MSHQEENFLQKYLNKTYSRFFLSRKEVYIPSYTSFGDPAEFPFFRNEWRREGNSIKSEEVIGQDYFIFCLTKQNPPKNVSMWEHYGKNGMKIVFDVKALISQIERHLNLLKKDDRIDFEIRRLDCQYFSAEVIKTRAEEIKATLSFDDSLNRDQIFEIATLKRDIFTWEQEVRLVIWIDGSLNLPHYKKEGSFLRINISDCFDSVVKKIEFYPRIPEQTKQYYVNNLHPFQHWMKSSDYNFWTY